MTRRPVIDRLSVAMTILIESEFDDGLFWWVIEDLSASGTRHNWHLARVHVGAVRSTCISLVAPCESRDTLGFYLTPASQYFSLTTRLLDPLGACLDFLLNL